MFKNLFHLFIIESVFLHFQYGQTADYVCGLWFIFFLTVHTAVFFGYCLYTIICAVFKSECNNDHCSIFAQHGVYLRIYWSWNLYMIAEFNWLAAIEGYQLHAVVKGDAICLGFSTFVPMNVHNLLQVTSLLSS